MLPSRFSYHRAGSLEEAFALLDQYGEDAKVLAGGQSLIPMMKLRFANPEHLIDVNHVGGSRRHRGARRQSADRRAGAAQQPRRVRRDRPLPHHRRARRRRSPTRSSATSGTIGGSLSHADPAGDLGSVMLALGASVVLSSSGGEREVPISDFLVDTFTTSIRPNELLTQIRVPAAAPALRRRLPEARAQGGRLGHRRSGRRAHAVERLHRARGDRTDRRWPEEPGGDGGRGRRWPAPTPGDDVFAEAGRLAAAASDPVSDVRGPADYKRHIIEVYVQRGMARALEHGAARPELGGNETMKVTVTINGAERTADVEDRLLLVHLIREVFELTGTHIGCDTSGCGACTVLLDGAPVKSCTMFGVQADGREVTTVEGLMDGAALNPIQVAFKEHHGLQCGYCTPGMMLVGAALIEEQPGAQRRRRPLGDLGQHLPLHRLHEHREGDPGRGRGEGEGRRSPPKPSTPEGRSTRADGHRDRGDPRHRTQRPPRRGRPVHPGQGQLHRRHQPARDALHGDPAQPLRAREAERDRRLARAGAATASSPSSPAS